ncbi:MAG: endonuclease/exonuclease/phosphatase family protein [Anaerolineae bacterium]|nr:endonuclease/exonuclease/phosphatase family protein [Anaerolineae bacterium]
MYDESRPSPTYLLLHRLLRCIGMLLLACADLYALGLILYFLLRLTTGFRLWPVALFSNFLHLALLANLVSLSVMLILRRWRRAALFSLPALAFVWLFGGLLIPRPAPVCNSAERCLRLTAMTYNLGDGGTNTSPEDIARIVLESGADVVGFQEVTASQAASMRNDMVAVYPYQTIYAAGESVNGVALLSRYPVVDEAVFYGDPKTMPNLAVTLDVQGRHLQVLVVHPPPPGWSPDWRHFYRSRAVSDAQIYTEMIADGPALLLGDLNATDQSQAYVILTQSGLGDAYRAAGFGFGPTFPSRKGYGYPFERAIPLVRLDYVLYTGQFKALRAWVGPHAGSDHLPVLAELAWQEEKAAAEMVGSP